MPEIAIIEIETAILDRLRSEGALGRYEYRTKLVVVKDDLFAEDETHKQLVREVAKAKDRLNEYEFKKRYNIL